MNDWLPVVFTGLMGLSMLLYVVLDGYDLGVGMLMPRATPAEKDVMIASIGPFWDANETWLVLGVGILLVAFPKAHGLVLTELYLPVMLMLIGLILRGVAFDFRVKAKAVRKPMWDWLFFTGSTLASATQGWMLGRYISGFGEGWNYPLFAAAIAVALPMAYVLLGATWLIMKTDGSQGILMNIIVGVIGAFIGGWIMSLIGQSDVMAFDLRSFLVALLGAVVLIWIMKLLKRS